MDLPVFMPLIISIIFPILIVVILFFTSYRRIRMINKILTSLGLKTKMFFISSQFKEKYNGEDLTFTLNYRGVNTHEALLMLSLPCPTYFDLSIEKGKKGLLSSIFDSESTMTVEELGPEYSVTTQEFTVITELLSDKNNVTSIKTIFSLGVESLYCDGKKLTIKINLSSLKKDWGRVREIVDRTIQFKNAIVSKATNYVRPDTVQQSFRGKVALYIVYGLPVVLSIASIVLAFMFGIRIREKNEPLNNIEFFIKGTIMVSPLLFLYLFISYKVLKAYYSSVAKKFATCLTLGLVWLFSMFPLVMELNGYLDRSIPEKRSGVVLFKTFGKGQSYYLHVGKGNGKIPENVYERFLGSTTHARISVKRHEYLKAEPGKTQVDFYVKKGFFNIPRIVRYEIR